MSTHNIHIQNNNLYEKYRDFTIASLDVLREISESGVSIPQSTTKYITIVGNAYNIDYKLESDYSFFIYRNETKIKELLEFSSCIEWMIQDPITKELESAKIVDEEGNPVENLDLRPFFERELFNFLSKFVYEYKTLDYNTGHFLCFYKKLEDYLYADELKFKDFSYLENFQCDLDEIDFGDNLKIRKYSNEEIEKLWQKFSIIQHEKITQLKFFIEIVYSIKKGEPIGNKFSSEMLKKVISCMRLFKSGIFGFNKIYRTPLMWSNLGMSSGGSGYNKTFMGNKYNLQYSDIEELKKFWNNFKKIDEKCNFLGIAVRKFNHAYERQRQEDKLIDYIIAFEALFSEGPSDLRYKIPVRVARLLETDIDQRKEIKSIMKAGYDARSNIVHGNKHVKEVKVACNDKNDECKKIVFWEFNAIIEEYLRKSIVKIVLKIKIKKQYWKISIF